MKIDPAPTDGWDQHFAKRTRHMRRSAIRELLKWTVQPDFISLAGGLPSPELFPTEEIRMATQTVLSNRPASALQYGETEGLRALREWIAEHFRAQGLPASAGNVLITSGAQQALDLIGRVFLEPGDRVLVENPTYLAALSAWRPWEVEFVAARFDAEGMGLDETSLRSGEKPKLAYCVPNFQNPQGTTLSLESRVRLIERLQREDVILVEDNPYGELRYEGIRLPHMITLDPPGATRAKVIYIGSFSKVLAPGLRVGWVIAPERVIDKLVLAKQAADLHTSTLSQHVILELVTNGLLERHVPKLREGYRERLDALLTGLERHCQADLSWTRPQGGMFLLATLAGPSSATDLLKRALERRVAFVPGEEFYVEGGGMNTFRLNFTGATPEKLGEGAKRLSEALAVA